MKKPIHQYNFWHGFLRQYVDFYLYTFYKRVTVVGKNNIPEGKPVILSINHQNALMDALTVLCTMKGQPIFMARADIFKSPTAAKILRFFKILPIYRIRDGVKNLQNNDAVFEEAVGVLENSKRLVILPEGNHFGQRRLRVLKKGVARIAFQAEERHNFELDIQIVPVGLDYSNYINFGSNLLVKFGKPFPLSTFKEAYLENNQKGMNALMQELRERMVPHMLNINDVDNYEEIEAIKDIYISDLKHSEGTLTNHLAELEKSQEIVDKLVELKQKDEAKLQELAKKATYIKEKVIDLKLRLWTINKRKYSPIGNITNLLLQILFLPVFIGGLIPNFAPFYLPVFLSKKIKDPQFLSSIRFVLSLVMFTLFYLIYLIVLLIFIKPFYLALSIFIAFPFIGYFSFIYYKWFKKTMAKYRINKLVRKKSKVWEQVLLNKSEIISELKIL